MKTIVLDSSPLLFDRKSSVFLGVCVPVHALKPTQCPCHHYCNVLLLLIHLFIRSKRSDFLISISECVTKCHVYPKFLLKSVALPNAFHCISLLCFFLDTVIN